MAPTIAFSFEASRFRSNWSRDSHSSTSRSVLRLSRSESRRTERQPGATRVGSRTDPSVRSNEVRTRSDAAISIEKTIKGISFSRRPHFQRSQEAGQPWTKCPFDRICLQDQGDIKIAPPALMIDIGAQAPKCRSLSEISELGKLSEGLSLDQIILLTRINGRQLFSVDIQSSFRTINTLLKEVPFPIPLH